MRRTRRTTGRPIKKGADPNRFARRPKSAIGLERAEIDALQVRRREGAKPIVLSANPVRVCMTNSTDEKPKDMARDFALRKLASWTALIVAVALVNLKIAAWFLTGSIALLSSAIDALVDTASTIVTFVGVRYAERPPDRDHRFGHGKGEAIAGFTQAMVLAGAALVLAFQSVERLLFLKRSGSLASASSSFLRVWSPPRDWSSYRRGLYAKPDRRQLLRIARIISQILR